MTTALITLAEYKAYAGITTTDATRDAQLQPMIDAATEAVRRYAGRSLDDGFSSVARTEAYDGNDTERLQLREYPVTSVASIVQTADDGSTQTIDSSEYRIEDAKTGIVAKLGAISGRFAAAVTWSSVGSWPRNRSIYPRDSWETSPSWTAGIQNFTVTYTGGYTTIPAGLKYVIYRWVDQLKQKQASGAFKSERIGAYAYELKDDSEWRSELNDLMRPYMTGVP